MPPEKALKVVVDAATKEGDVVRRQPTRLSGREGEELIVARDDELQVIKRLILVGRRFYLCRVMGREERMKACNGCHSPILWFL